MILAYVLINTCPTKEHSVYRALSKVKEIFDLCAVFGDYDLIAKVEVKDLEHLSPLVLDKIRKISGVVDTKTLIVTQL
jgi:DNA-binding Lrp family transcriptional regulator